MASGRTALVDVVATSAGTNAISVHIAHKGWPAEVKVLTADESIPVALHVGPVGNSHRGRDSERRFQNPGADRPVLALGGGLPILLGVWQEEGKTVFVGLDGRSRVGRKTRFSLFVPLDVLRAAGTLGWIEHFNTNDEKLIAFLPGLLPAYVQVVRAGIDIDATNVSAIVDAAGMTDEENAAAARGRRTVSTLIRNAVFSQTVRKAYGGFCAMCGLNHSLVVGAHIFPVAAKGAPDKPWNGLALCHNHHAAFDAHKIYVDPDDHTILVHPDLIRDRAQSEACQDFIDKTFPTLALPVTVKDHPKREMLVKRYEFFSSKYAWATT